MFLMMQKMEQIEPSIDYNDKQVRFSSIVLDTEEDILKPIMLLCLKIKIAQPNLYKYASFNTYLYTKISQCISEVEYL
jgi:hypothetical protein